MSLLPCASCPWRADQDAAAVANVQPPLRSEPLRRLLGNGDDAFSPVMQCHGSPDDKPQACRGYLAQAGITNLNVRMLLLKGMIPTPAAVLSSCKRAGIGLHGSKMVLLKILRGEN